MMRPKSIHRAVPLPQSRRALLWNMTHRHHLPRRPISYHLTQDHIQYPGLGLYLTATHRPARLPNKPRTTAQHHRKWSYQLAKVRSGHSTPPSPLSPLPPPLQYPQYLSMRHQVPVLRSTRLLHLFPHCSTHTTLPRTSKALCRAQETMKPHLQSI